MIDGKGFSRSTQVFLLVVGGVFVAKSLGPALTLAQSGLAEITFKRTTYTGPLAAVVIVGFLIGGIGLFVSAVRNLLSSKS